MANKGFGNFAFMKSRDPQIYMELCQAERTSRLGKQDHVGANIRNALAQFIGNVITDHGLQAYFPQHTSLYEKIRNLSSPEFMRQAGVCHNGDPNRGHVYLPCFLRKYYCVTYEAVDAQGQIVSQTDGYYYLLREYGNVDLHPEGQFRLPPRMCYANTVVCLRVFHEILRAYYRVRSEPEFQEERMPIEDYIITAARVPKDRERSLCAMEFDGYMADYMGDPSAWVLLRMYRRSELGQTFMLRNHDSMQAAVSVSRMGHIEGLPQIREVTPWMSNGDFYIIAYHFHRKSEPLSNALLGQMALDQRLELCRCLAACLAKLHGAKIPIYHRLLNYECIYLNHDEEGWMPLLVKFDYAKIQIATKGTVIDQTHSAMVNLMQNTRLAKYISPEWWQSEYPGIAVDWSKVDVYAMGVLMAEILLGKVGTEWNIEPEPLQELGVPEPVLELLGRMMDQQPQLRGTMAEAAALLERKEW